MAYTPPTLPYYGPVAHNSGSGNLPLKRIVIHCTAGGSDGQGAQGTAKYFQTKAAGGSAHYITDSDETIQCAYDNIVCWHAPPNTHSLGIEMVCSLANKGQGHWTFPSHVAMMRRTAKLVAQKCLQYAIPIRIMTVAQVRAEEKGICGHDDVSKAFGQSSHWDPGPYFPWNTFLAMVQAEAAAITTPVAIPPVKVIPIPGDGTMAATDADRVIAKMVEIQKTSEAGRYADLKAAITEWAEIKDNARQTVLLDKLDVLIAAVNKLPKA